MDSWMDYNSGEKFIWLVVVVVVVAADSIMLAIFEGQNG